MQKIKFSQISNFDNHTLIHLHEDCEIKHLIIDSRKATMSQGSIFLAIEGNHHNGHDFIELLYQKGIRHFVVEYFEQKWASLKDCSFIKTNSSINTLQLVATLHRKQFNFPILAITGSNAKTIIKEWLSQLLSAKYQVAKSPKSYNSQIGVPLSIWEIAENHNFGVFEAGISQKNEMQLLEKVIQPTLGLITNIGTAHDEGFDNIDQKIEEKLELFKNVDTLFYCEDHIEIYKHVEKLKINKFSWSLQMDSADIFFKIINKDHVKNITKLELWTQDSLPAEYYEVPFADSASLENVLHCISILKFLKFKPAEIKISLSELKNTSMRLEIKPGINQCMIIDDSYNNDWAGLKVAIDYLAIQPSKFKKTIILSDIAELKNNQSIVYQQLADILKPKGINRVIAIGNDLYHYQLFFADYQFEYYQSTDDFKKMFNEDNFENEAILVKGARKFHFERITNLLQSKQHRTLLEINLDSLTHNLNYYRSIIKPKTKLMVMVKAFAYGSGLVEVANLLQYHKVDYLAVAYGDEGVELRKAGINLPIMVMNTSENDFENLIKYQLEPAIGSTEILQQLLFFIGTKLKQKIKIHLELETGMNRLGLDSSCIDKVIEKIKSHPSIEIQSIFSHLAAADDDDFKDFSTNQFQKFQFLSAKIEQEFSYPILKHICNSAGIVSYPEFHLDMVRLGIGLYGIEASDKNQDKLELVTTLKARISQIKHINQNETVGYSRKGKLQKNSIIATISIGYGDGYNRLNSNGVGQILVNDILCPTVGNICMDMCMIDISEIKNVNIGDEVIIFGKKLPIQNVAKAIKTIPYEILTSISERVKRVYYSE